MRNIIHKLRYWRSTEIHMRKASPTVCIITRWPSHHTTHRWLTSKLTAVRMVMMHGWTLLSISYAAGDAACPHTQQTIPKPRKLSGCVRSLFIRVKKALSSPYPSSGPFKYNLGCSAVARGLNSWDSGFTGLKSSGHPCFVEVVSVGVYNNKCWKVLHTNTPDSLICKNPQPYRPSST